MSTNCKKDHFNSDEHIQKFNSVIEIDITSSFEHTFIAIKCKFLDTRYNYIYTDLYFKKHIKNIILENIDENQYYKSYITKKNMITVNHNDDKYFFSEKFNSNNIISDANRIESLEKNEQYMKPYLMKNNTDDYEYDINQIYEDLDKINMNKTGNVVKTISSIGCIVNISQCELLRGSSLEKVPKIFYNSKIINIIKNTDEKCFLYCYIRKYLNPIKKHSERVSKLDIKIAKELENLYEYNFDNVRINDLNKIEDLFEKNIYVYTCDMNMKNKIPIYKSDKIYKKYLDLLLYENHYMIIKKMNLFFNSDSRYIFCRNCCNSFYSKSKYDDHIQFCNTNKTMILMPSRYKYLEFRNMKNTIKLPFTVFADIESYMVHKNAKQDTHNHLMSGYYLNCTNEKYSKEVKLFDKLEDFRDSLISELDYIEDINDNVFYYEIDMSTFDQEKFDKTTHCKYCNYDFQQKHNGRIITLREIVDKYKLKRIIDDFEYNNINKETQDNLIKYYKSLDKN